MVEFIRIVVGSQSIFFFLDVAAQNVFFSSIVCLFQKKGKKKKSKSWAGRGIEPRTFGWWAQHSNLWAILLVTIRKG